MRDHDVDAKVEVVGGAAAANGAAVVARKRRKLRRWNVEEKIRIARESLSSAETITAVAHRHGVTRRMLSTWRALLCEGKLVAPSLAQAQPAGALAAVAVEERHSVVIKGRGVTVRLNGTMDTAGIAAIAVALAGSR